MSEDASEDKQHEPTQRKLEKSREKGEMPRSVDLTAAAAYGGLFVFAILLGAKVLADVAGALALFFARSAEAVEGGAVFTMAWGIVAEVSGPASLAFLFPMLAVVVAVTLQRAWVFAPEKLAPKASRISIVQNAKQKFGSDGIFDFAKSTVKLVLFSALMGMFLWARIPEMIVQIATSERMVTGRALSDVAAFLGLTFAVALGAGVADLLWQRASHLRRNRMSHKELSDEMKEAEGDPHVRQQRRQRGYEIATNRMLRDIPDADVVIVNPTHYAVALKWSRARNRAPVCVAKGTDETARRIRTIAAEAGVPVRRDAPTARALHASVAVGDEILPEHYRPVAAAIRFAEAMRRRAREGRRR